MNTLNKDLHRGEVVVLSQDLFEHQEYDVYHRAFIVESGEGASADDAGTELFGYWLAGRAPDVAPADMIDAVETADLQAQLKGGNGGHPA